jgi:hypothetical protein
MAYRVQRAEQCPELQGNWDGPVWGPVDTIDISNFRPRSSDHRPFVQAKLLHDDQTIYGIYNVVDRYVKAVHTEYQSCVCRDSCVEFFVHPNEDKGYFNFEFSACGAFLVYYVTDTTKRPDGEFVGFIELPEEDGRLVSIYTSLPCPVDPEIEDEVTWQLEFSIPIRIFEKYIGEIGDPAGQTWRANLYKCGDETSHPHWASWMPLPETNFHLPEFFGTLVFEE